MEAASEKLREVVKSRYWRREDAEVVIGAWRASGDTVSGFARKWSLKAKRIARWVAEIEGRAGESEVSFHPVRVVEPTQAAPVAEPAEPAACWVGEVRYGDFVVRVPSGFAADEMARLLAVVAEVQPC